MANGGHTCPEAAEGDATHSDAPSFELDDEVDSVRHGRWFVQQRVAALGAPQLVDDAGLIAGELLANARQHGEAPVVVRVDGGPTAIRVEVRDASPRSPIRPTASLSNMTGRGLALVEALSHRWGVRRERDGGKTVWCDLTSADVHPPEHADDGAEVDVDAILAGWDDDLGTTEQRFTVVLGDVPTPLLLEAKAHIDNVVREFSLAAAAGATSEASVPEDLAQLIDTVVHGFTDARAAIKRQALAATQRNEARTNLTLHLPLSAADAGEAYLAALDEADNYARAARLLTLETPPEHRVFRNWYVQSVVDAVRQLAAGRVADPPIPFEQRLVAEVRHLAAAGRASERAARLQRVTAALARSRRPEDVALVVVSEGVAALGASGGGLLVPAGDGEHIAVPGVVGYAEGLVGQLREERLDAPLPAATALRTGEPVWLESRAERDRLYPMLRGFEASTVSMCAVPLVVGDRTIGALRFSFDTRKLFDDDERAFVLALAALTAQTLQRTELYAAERQAAIDLQRALLPQEMTTIPGWDIAAYYNPAGEQAIGGDFYDVIPVSDGRIVAIVGDVMGRGVHAAAAMAEIRSTIRAYAIDEPDPVSLFGRVDRFFDEFGISQLVTVLYFLVDTDNDVVHVGNAGHLEPILVGSKGGRIVHTDTGLPFGVYPSVRELTTVSVPHGTALLAITDGLVERRGEDIDVGIQRLVDATANTQDLSARALLDHVVRAAAAERAHDDDVTVLVLRRL